MPYDTSQCFSTELCGITLRVPPVAPKGSAKSNRETKTKRHLRPLDVFSVLLVHRSKCIVVEAQHRTPLGTLQCSWRPPSWLAEGLMLPPQEVLPAVKFWPFWPREFPQYTLSILSMKTGVIQMFYPYKQAYKSLVCPSVRWAINIAATGSASKKRLKTLTHHQVQHHDR